MRDGAGWHLHTCVLVHRVDSVAVEFWLQFHPQSEARSYVVAGKPSVRENRLDYIMVILLGHCNFARTIGARQGTYTEQKVAQLLQHRRNITTHYSGHVSCRENTLDFERIEFPWYVPSCLISVQWKGNVLIPLHRMTAAAGARLSGFQPLKSSSRTLEILSTVFGSVFMWCTIFHIINNSII